MRSLMIILALIFGMTTPANTNETTETGEVEVCEVFEYHGTQAIKTAGPMTMQLAAKLAETRQSIRKDLVKKGIQGQVYTSVIKAQLLVRTETCCTDSTTEVKCVVRSLRTRVWLHVVAPTASVLMKVNIVNQVFLHTKTNRYSVEITGEAVDYSVVNSSYKLPDCLLEKAKANEK